jgi:hypothetical protein
MVKIRSTKRVVSPLIVLRGLERLGKSHFLIGYIHDSSWDLTLTRPYRLLELHRRIARGHRNCDNYRLRMPLIAGDLDPRPLPDIR